MGANPKVVVDSSTYFCQGDSLFITASGADSVTWYKPNYKQWYPGAKLVDKPIQSLTYSVKVITNEGCSDSATAKGILVKLPGPVTINKQAETLIANHSAGTYTYNWYVNDTLLLGIISKSFRPSKSGNYKVIITDFAGCSSFSQPLFFQFVQKPDAIGEFLQNQINLYPNPASKQIFVNGLEEGVPASAVITDLAGRIVAHTNLATNAIDISSLATGVYFITIGQSGRYAVKKMMVE